MKVSGLDECAARGLSRSRFYRSFAVVLATLMIVGCSAQPMTLDQELAAGAVAGTIGAASGAVFAYSASKSYPVSSIRHGYNAEP